MDSPELSEDFFGIMFFARAVAGSCWSDWGSLLLIALPSVQRYTPPFLMTASHEHHEQPSTHIRQRPTQTNDAKGVPNPKFETSRLDESLCQAEET